MAYELLNFAQVTPARLYAFLRLIARLKAPQKEDILTLLQPPALFTGKGDQEDEEGTSNVNSSANIYTAARNCNLIEEDADGIVKLLEGVAKKLDTIEHFRLLMQQRVWNARLQEQNNYLFNLYCAWYIAQNERIFTFEDKDFEIHFNEEMFKDANQRTFNMTKFNGWRTWAVFLGTGRTVKPGILASNTKASAADNSERKRTREILQPDASLRLRGVLPSLFAQPQEQMVSFSFFLQELSQFCPELDGGDLFQQCLEARHDYEQRAAYLSLAISTGLRQLHYSGLIKLIREADSTDTWQLYPASGHDLHLNEVTHIQFLGQNSNGK